ncbi:type IV pilus assembly protein PilE [Parelusimicrobium proximum]|uniref:type IV pilin protein n=1 Tax=Parelusimicrobium proximum TaxID=3228953 RepID=UPI003D164047
MKKGFTLIELLVVVLIIAILAAVALPQYTAAVEKSRATEALVVLKALKDAEDRAYLAHDKYVPLDQLEVSAPESNYFTYGTDEANMVSAVRKTTDAYSLDFYFSDPAIAGVGNRIACSHNYHAKHKRLCSSLGCTTISDSAGYCIIQ